MDTTLFKDKEIFNIFKSNKVVLEDKMDNLLDISNDVVFIWDNEECCLLTQGVRTACTTCQELRPSEIPHFRVQNLSVNDSGTRAVLWAPEGVAVMDLPWRCGSKLEFQDGKPKILTRCRNINITDLAFEAQIVQVRWNSNSSCDSSLVILTSDNSIYHYDVMPSECVNVETFRVGCRPFSRQKTLAALGETAVDFCFAPIFLNLNKESAENCVLLVLRGNGDVLLVMGTSGDGDEGNVLSISPLPQENCLSDACAILSIAGKPPKVIIATSRGVVYHTLLVPSDVDQLELPIHMRRYRLLVIESVTLDAGLLQPHDDLSPFPLRLILDPNHIRRYLIIQPSGVHSVLMNCLRGVEDLLSMSQELASQMPMSTIEYLVCSGSPLSGCVAQPFTLVAVNDNNEVFTVPLRRVELPPLELFTPQQTDYSSNDSPISQHLKQPFYEEVEKLLQESRAVPHLKLSKEEIPREKLLALLVRIGDSIRNVTAPRFLQVKEMLDKRMKLICALRDLQLEEIERLKADREAFQLSVEEFAEKLQSAADDLEDKKERVQSVVKQIAEAEPTLTKAELRLQESVAEVEAKLDKYALSVEKLKKHNAYQEAKIPQSEQQLQSELVLNKKQISALRSCLDVMGDNVSQLVQQVNDMNDTMGLGLSNT